MWELTGNVAKLVGEAHQATLKLDEPFRGLVDWTVDGQKLADQLLAIHCDDDGNTFDWPVADAYVRQGDLCVTYGTTMSRPFSLEAYWRELATPHATAGIEVVVSMQTELLETHPSFSLTSILPGAVSARDFALASSAILLHAEEGWSIAELADPADFACGGTTLDDATGGALTHWQLRPEFLEKGVIRRVRMRSLALPRAGDAKAAEACFEELRAEAPPLTT